jgi:hypothetical protein
MSPLAALSPEPIYSADYPVHAHRVHVYREALAESGMPWGYDPAVGAGVVMRPTTDAGAKPQQVLGVFLSGAAPGTVLRLFTCLAGFTFPLWTWIAASRLGLSPSARLWALTTLLIPAWLYRNFEGFFQWGLAAFATSAYFAPLALVAFLEFVARPTWTKYLVACGTIALTAFLHVLAPVVLVPGLFSGLWMAKGWPSRWYWASAAAPFLIIAVSSFWFVPFILDLGTPGPHGREFNWYPDDLTYLSLDELLHALSPFRVATALGALMIGGIGLWSMRRTIDRRTAWAFAMCAIAGLALKFGGSFLPGVSRMQPSRFMISAFALMVIPVSLALDRISSGLRLPQGVGPLAALAAALCAAGWMGRPGEGRKYENYAGDVEVDRATFLGLPEGVALPTLLTPLTEFVSKRTGAGDRLLVQTLIQCEPKILAHEWRREVIGSCYPDSGDPAQFLKKRLWGRKLDEWTPDDLNQAVLRWGVSWAFTCTPDAARLFEAATGKPGEDVGEYRAFRFPSVSSRFEKGQGLVSAKVNRLELDDLRSKDGLVVLRYRYHPAWQAENGEPVLRFPVPEDPAGFIALRNPPGQVHLNFKPWSVFRTTWPPAIETPLDATPKAPVSP